MATVGIGTTVTDRLAISQAAPDILHMLVEESMNTERLVLVDL
jgi:hypothetical protein